MVIGVDGVGGGWLGMVVGVGGGGRGVVRNWCWWC